MAKHLARVLRDVRSPWHCDARFDSSVFRFLVLQAGPSAQNFSEGSLRPTERITEKVSRNFLIRHTIKHCFITQT